MVLTQPEKIRDDRAWAESSTVSLFSLQMNNEWSRDHEWGFCRDIVDFQTRGRRDDGRYSRPLEGNKALTIALVVELNISPGFVNRILVRLLL